jgi:protein TonB
MASPAEIAHGLPETLPADFGEWDSEASLAAVPGKSSRFEATHASGVTAKPLRQSAGRDATLTSVVDRTRDASSPSAAPFPADVDAFLRNGKLISPSAERSLSPASQKPEASHATKPEPRITAKPEAGHAANGTQPLAWRWPNVATVGGKPSIPEAKAAASQEVDAALFESFHSGIEERAEQKTARKKWMIVVPASTCSILLLLIFIIPRFNSGPKSVAKPSVQSPAAAAETEPDSSTPMPSDQAQLNENQPVASTEKQQTTDIQPAKEEEAAKPTQVQAEMMNDQLTAPTQIPKGDQKQVAEDAPPASIGAADADGLSGSGAIGSVFNGHAQSVVKAPPPAPVVISAGVATGRLIQSTPPSYPTIAKSARVGGTVELEATISTLGTIKDLHVVSGPQMLRQSAVDAVRNWRYKPYLLNNKPIEVQTTINVIFSLGG